MSESSEKSSIWYVSSKPVYVHDCKHCEWLGRVEGHDLYACPSQPLGPSLVVRFSSEPPDYESYPMGVYESTLAQVAKASGPFPVRVAMVVAYALYTSKLRSAAVEAERQLGRKAQGKELSGMVEVAEGAGSDET